MLKRIISLFSIFFLVITLSSCQEKEKLFLLNWGEYISQDVVDKFEEEYNCTVVISLADSNEAFYSKVKGGTTVYDLVVPSDYMVEKMYTKNLIQEIDFTRLSNFTTKQDTYNSDCLAILNQMDSFMEANYNVTISNYCVPYFWASWCLMYNKRCEGLEQAITKAASEGNVWKVMFENSAVPQGTRIGQYDGVRYSYTSVMNYLGKDINAESDENIKLAANAFANKKFNVWGTDQMKKSISTNNLDLCWCWTGDYLDVYYTDLGDGETTPDDLTYGCYIPDDTITFVDSLVLTKNARHVDLAYKFINFMLDPENAYINASEVGYCTPVKQAFNMIIDPENNIEGYDPEEINNYGVAMKYWKQSYIDCYDGTKAQNGKVLTLMSQSFIKKLNNLCNNARV